MKHIGRTRNIQSSAYGIVCSQAWTVSELSLVRGLKKIFIEEKNSIPVIYGSFSLLERHPLRNDNS